VLSCKAAVLRGGSDEDLLEAVTLLEQAYRIYDGALGARHMDTAQAQLALAMTHFELDEYADARPHFIQSLDVFREVVESRASAPGEVAGGNGGSGADRAAYLRGHLDRRADRAGAPLATAGARGVQRGEGGATADAATHIPDVLNCLATMHHHQGDVRGARQLYTEALRQYMNLFGEAHPHVAKVPLPLYFPPLQ